MSKGFRFETFAIKNTTDYRLIQNAQKLIEMRVDPELIDKHRGSHFQINIIERE